MNAPSPIDALRSPQQSVAQPSNLLTLLQSQKVMENLKKVAGKQLDAGRLIRLAIYSVKTTPKLALCTPSSVLGAVMLAGSFGLEPNTPSQQCFLIPYKKRRKVAGKWIETYECQFQFGYRGMITLSYRSGIVTRLKAEAIRQNDEFDYSEGSQFFLKYRKALRDRGELIGAFCFTELNTDRGAASVLPGEFIETVRNKSQTYRTLRDAMFDPRSNEKDRLRAEIAYNEQPWILWDDQMWAKTSIKHHTGQLPMFTSAHTILSAASAVDDAGDAGIIDMDDFVDPEAAIAAANGEINVSSEDNEDPPPPEREQETARITQEIGNIALDPGKTRELAPAEQEAEPPRKVLRDPPLPEIAKQRPAVTRAEHHPPVVPEEAPNLFGPAE